MLTYTSPDGHHLETVRVVLTERGVRAAGFIVSAGKLTYGASYSVIADADGYTRRATVRCVTADGERSLTLTRSPDGPWLAEGAGGTATPVPELAPALDVYLGGSPFSASLAIRRLNLQAEPAEHTVTVAAISLPSLTVKPVEHHARTVSVDDNGATISYSGPFGDRNITVDTEGLFVESAGLATRLG